MNTSHRTRQELMRMLHIASVWAFEDDETGDALWKSATWDDIDYAKYRDDWISDYKQALYDKMLECLEE